MTLMRPEQVSDETALSQLEHAAFSLQAQDQFIEQVERQLKTLKRERIFIETKMHRGVAIYYGVTSTDLAIGHRSCAESVIGRCIFDMSTMDADDECLVCRRPNTI